MDIKLYWAFADKYKLTLTQTMSLAAIIETQGEDGVTRLSQVKLAKQGLVSYLTFRAAIEVLYDRNIIVAVEGGIQSNYKIGIFEYEEPKAMQKSWNHPYNSKFPTKEEHPTNRKRQKYRDEQHARIGNMSQEQVDQVEGVSEEVGVEVADAATENDHGEAPFHTQEVSIYDKCFGAAKRVHGEWLTSKRSGGTLSLDRFTRQWVMEGESEPTANEPLTWGSYQQELAYRLSLLYKEND